jgi:hypothetical protein
MRRLTPSTAAFLGFLVAAAVGAQLTPIGIESRVDDDRSLPDPVECPQLAVAPDGDFVVTWTPEQLVGGGACQPDGAIYGRFFDAHGVPRTPGPTRIVLAEDICIDDVQLGPLVNGSAVALWRESFGELDPFSSLVGATFSDTGGLQALPLLPQAGRPIGMLDSGGFVFLFSRGRLPGFDAERYDRHGARIGKRFTVGRATGRYTGFGVAELANGQLVFTWITDRRADGRTLVVARRFDRQGRAVGPEIVVNDRQNPPNILHPALVATSANGSFVVGWTGAAPGGNALARAFRANGTPQTTVLTGNTSPGDQVVESLATSAGGEFVLTWQRLHRPLRTPEVMSRLFTPEGFATYIPEPLPSQANGFQSCGTIRSNGKGTWIASWLGDGPQGYGVYIRRFTSIFGVP